MRSLLLVSLLISAGAFAQVQQLGEGRDGPLEVTAPGTTVNRSTALAEDAAAGDPFITVVDSSPFNAGSVVLVVHTQWQSDGERYRIGEYSVHFVERVVGTRVELGSPLNRPWRRGEGQAVLVPQFTDVTVTSTGSLVAPAWNGSSGGVLAFLATGRVSNDGLISATGAGFRGGTAREVVEAEAGCMSDNEPAARGAERGESVLIGGFGTTSTGRGANDSGGGGGVCRYSGGGGGGSLGEGGQGGLSADGRRDVGGVGGQALTFAGLVLGGGGGATTGTGGQGRGGGRGGGAIFIRARSLDGSGHMEANGAAGAAPTNRLGSGSGAGGAGSIIIEVVDDARCALFANGGVGGSGVEQGPGGGGGGGHLSLRARKVLECPRSVAGGEPGRVMGIEFGAVAGAAGKTSVREVGSSLTPFPNGPGTTLTRLGCGCSGSEGLGTLPLLLLALFRRTRLRAPSPASVRQPRRSPPR
ncbi:MAG: hypothetical protein GQE15_32980 [Archangiaceae bacterium]|nr:hypothetical protein [Archangiaceae bacterium]